MINKIDEDLIYKLVEIYKKLEQKPISKKAVDRIKNSLDRIDKLIDNDNIGFQGKL